LPPRPSARQDGACLHPRGDRPNRRAGGARRSVPSRRRRALDTSAEHRKDRGLGRCQGLPEGASPRRTSPSAGRPQASALTLGTTRIELAPEVLDDFDRFFDHITELGAATDASQRISDLVSALDILARSPLIGRKVKGGNRELVIGRSSRGYVALYRFLPDMDTIFVLALRSQRESDYKRRR